MKLEQAERDNPDSRPIDGPIEAIRFTYNPDRPLTTVYLGSLAVTAAAENIRPRFGWSAAGACWEHADPSIFFPDIFHPDDEAKWAEAAAVCDDCPVRTDCLEAGIDERFGLWGGLDWAIRKEISWHRAALIGAGNGVPPTVKPVTNTRRTKDRPSRRQTKPRRPQDARPDETWRRGDSVDVYLKEIGKAPSLAPEETHELASILQACKKELENNRTTDHLTDERKAELEERRRQACNRIVESNLRLVIYFAKPLAKQARHLDFLDLIQAGNQGLMTAADRFKPEKGFRFATYAKWWIRRTILTEIGNLDRSIRLPMYVNEYRGAVYSCRSHLVQELGRWASDEEVADFLGCDVEQVRQSDRHGHEIDSLDQPFHRDAKTPLGEFVTNDILEDTEAPDIFTRIAQSEQAEAVAELLSYLDPLERAALEHYCGFEDGDVSPGYRGVGRKLGLNRETARLLIDRAQSKFLRLFYGQRPNGPTASVPRLLRDDFPAVIGFEYEDNPVMTEVADSQPKLRLAASGQPPADTAWLKRGHCLDFDLNAFYPRRGESTRRAQAVCLACPVKTPCLEHALWHNYQGIWGATTGRMRRKIIRRRSELSDISRE